MARLATSASSLGEAPTCKGANAEGGAAENSPMQGVQVDELTSDIRQQLGLGADVKGVVVAQVPDGSPASDAGLQRGDVIEQVNRKPVNSVDDYDRLIREAGKQSLVLLVNRGGSTKHLAERHPDAIFSALARETQTLNEQETKHLDQAITRLVLVGDSVGVTPEEMIHS